MTNKLLIYIGVLILTLNACNNKKDDPTPGSSDDNYKITSVTPSSGKVGDQVTITTNRIENISRIIFNGIEVINQTITNNKLVVTIPEYAAKTGKIILEVKDKNIKAESNENFSVEYPANQLAFLGGEARWGALGFTIGTKIYVGLGNGSTSTDFWEYDTQTDTWTQIADFPGGKRSHAASFVLDNKAYVGTGKLFASNNNHTWYKDLWQYDPTTDQWTQKADFPGNAREEAVGFSIAGKGYIGTGDAYNGKDNIGAQKDFWQYDPTNDTWTQKADFGGSNLRSAVSFVIDNKAYVGTGNSGVKSFWQYDPTTDQWTKKADFGGGQRSNAISFTLNSKGYVGLGSNLGESGSKQDIWSYDPTTDQWTKAADFEGGARNWAVAVVLGNTAYIGTGFGNSTVSQNFGSKKDFWIYKPQ